MATPIIRITKTTVYTTVIVDTGLPNPDETSTTAGIRFLYHTGDNSVDISFIAEDKTPYYYSNVAIANLYIGGTVVANKDDFYTKLAAVFINAGSAAIPTRADALVLLDGSILDVSGTKYFIDRRNGWNFPIAGYDFQSDWTIGFPYKSAATISAPVGNATLIAADLNNFLYDSGGTPNQIPVVSLFQDVDYEHKMFSRHQAAQLDANGVEILEARVVEFVVYNSVRTGTLLTKCQKYFRAPTEQAGAVYLSPAGNDTTGAGTKASPWRSLSKIVTTSATYVYLKTGDYSPGALVIFTGSALNLVGIGRSTFTIHTSGFGMTFTRVMTCKGIHILNTASSFGINMSNDVTFDFCKLTNSGSGKFITTQVAAKNLVMNNTYGASTGTGDGIFYASVAFNSVTLTGCYLLNSATNPFYIGLAAGAYLQKNTRMKGVFASNGIGDILGGKQVSDLTGSITSIKYANWYGFADITATNNLQVVNNTFSNAINTIPLRVKAANNAAITGVKINDNYVTGNRNSSYIVYIGGTAGEQGFNAINGLEFLRNTVINTSPLTTGTCHTVIICAGIDNKMKWNDLTVPNGYGIVVKAAGRHYTTTDAQLSYNVIRCTGTAQYLIYNRGAWGLICANNTILNHAGGAAIRVDGDDLNNFDNTLLCINNVITLAANISSSAIDYTSVGMTSRNNVIVKNGFTTAIATGVNDLDAVIAFDSNGVPAVRIDNGEVIAVDSNIGLASDYFIGDNLKFKTQDAIWQKGAIVK